MADSWNNKIRRIETSTAAVITFAGTNTSGSADGTGSAARFYLPTGITTDGVNLYVADFGNNEIRQIVIATRAVTTLAGATASGYVDSTGSAARFYRPYGIATDGTNVYAADSYNNCIRQVVIASRVVTTLAGSTTSGNSDGIGTAAGFSHSRGITTDGTNVFVADTGNSKIRKIALSTAAVTTVAGSSTGGFTDGTGSSASFSGPEGITMSANTLYVGDTGNGAIRIIKMY